MRLGFCFVCYRQLFKSIIYRCVLSITNETNSNSFKSPLLFIRFYSWLLMLQLRNHEGHLQLPHLSVNVVQKVHQICRADVQAFIMRVYLLSNKINNLHFVSDSSTCDRLLVNLFFVCAIQTLHRVQC